MLHKIATFLIISLSAALSMQGATTGNSGNVVASAADKTFYMTVEGTTPTATGRLASVKLSMGRLITNHMNINGAEVRKSIDNITFPSMIDALNALSVNGWRLVSAYTVEVRGSIVERWILAKDVEDINQLLEGLVKM